MKLNKILNLTKQLTKKKTTDELDKTIIMSEKASVEETAFPQQLANRYSVKRSLGKGAFGIVYLAEDRKIGRLVAIKQLYKSYVKDIEIHERFMQEARIGAQLDHPNIINVFSLEEDKKSACIIMEYLSGGSLANYMMKNTIISPSTALDIFKGVITGLNAAHKVMAIHRDIKPQNIIFDHLGTPKISDFGIAFLPVNAGGAPIIESETSNPIIGTPRYMSPEQISRKKIDQRSDLYSAGAVLYEMLTGEKLFDISKDMNFSEISDIILNKTPKYPNTDIPSDIVQMTMKLLNKAHDKRYATAEELLIDIDKITLNSKKNNTNNGAKISHIGRSGPVLSSPIAIFEDIICLLLVDGVLAPSERKELNSRAERLGISEAQSRLIEDKIRTERSLPLLNSIEEYQTLAENLYASSENLKLLPEQKEILKEKRKALKIKVEEGKILKQQAREKIRIKNRRKK